MKAFRIAALGVALLVGGATVASAQATSAAPQQQGQGQGGGRGFNRSLTGIELTDAQKAKFAEITAKYQPEMQLLRESFQSGGDRAEGMKKMQALREKMTPEVRAILTPEQRAIYDKNLAEQKARFEQMQKGGAGR
jgi:Spy/CpxP family protein refolding chaperone